jgi:hypothetical protein
MFIVAEPAAHTRIRARSPLACCPLSRSWASRFICREHNGGGNALPRDDVAQHGGQPSQRVQGPFGQGAQKTDAMVRVTVVSVEWRRPHDQVIFLVQRPRLAGKHAGPQPAQALSEVADGGADGRVRAAVQGYPDPGQPVRTTVIEPVGGVDQGRGEALPGR